MLGSPSSPYRSWAPPATHGVYSLFPNTDTVYQPSARYHHTLTHPKESLFALATPPVFHSPVPTLLPQPSPVSGGIAQLELMTKGFNNNNNINITNNNNNNNNNNVKRFDDRSTPTTKRRWEVAEVKSENRSCGCRHSPSPSRLILPRATEATSAFVTATAYGGDAFAAERKKSENHANSGCSRTNPVSLRVAPVAASAPANIGIVNDLLVGDVNWHGTAGIVIKKEPGGGCGVVTPCQVPEVTTSVAAPVVKIEEGCRKEVGNGGIPVGIAVARQRNQQQEAKVALCGGGVQQDMQQAITTMALVQPHCEDRLTNGMSPWAGTTNHTTTLSPPTSTLWQYPAMGVEPMAPVGYQLIRDPMTGHFLLIPAASVLWPTYQQSAQQITTQHGAAEPIGYERILVQQTQPQVQQVQQQLRANVEVKSRPLRVKEEKMQEPNPAPQHYMLHPEPLPLSLDTGKRSQATSPVSCITPPCDNNGSQSESEDGIAPPPVVTVQDASNQTDAPCASEDETLTSSGDITSSVLAIVDFAPATHNASIGVGTDAQEVYEKSSELLPFNGHCDVETKLPAEEIYRVHLPESDMTESNISREVVVPPVISVCENNEMTRIPLNVDLSGLELLSNSIEQFERVTECAAESPDNNIPEEVEISEEKAAETLQLLSRRKERVRSEYECENVASITPGNMLGGLGLLCALAEQRFMEEVATGVNAEVERFTAKRPAEPDLSDVNRNYKTRKSERDCRKFIASKVQQYYTSGPNSPVAFSNGSCISPPPGELMDAMELNMRMRLAELQRKYREKQKELSKLTPKKYDPDSVTSPTKRGPGRPRKKCSKFHLDSPPESPKIKSQRRESQPPVLEKITDTRWTSDISSKPKSSKLDILKPPTLTANRILTSAKFKPEMRNNGTTNGKGLKLTTTNGSPVRLGDGSLKMKEADKTEKLKSKTECTEKKSGENESMFWFKSTQEQTPTKPEDKPVTLSPSLSFSSSKKRKVGRPKKHLTSPSIATETIVAKKPKSKSSLVGFLLTKSRRLSSSDVPSTFKSANAYARPLSMVNTYIPPGYKNTSTSVEVFPGTENSVTAGGEKKKVVVKSEEVKSHKILPKLKAEAKVKTWTCGDEDDVIDWMHGKKEEKQMPKPVGQLKRKSSVISMKLDAQVSKPKIAKKSPTNVSAPAIVAPPSPPKISTAITKTTNNPVTTASKANGAASTPASPTNRKRAKRSESTSTSSQSPGTSESDDVPLIVYSKKNGCRCLLTEAHLETERLRALALMNGLFYAGELSPIQPPDVYGIKLDGERGNKPHILTREEVLKDAILEVRAGSLAALPPGTRVCAYWSQQYRALYPGTVAPNETDDAHSALVSVEFDDGDNGRMGVDDIRLLPEDYPIVEYDPNPLLTLGRRRRQASGASCESHSRRASADVAHANNKMVATKPPEEVPVQEALVKEVEVLEADEGSVNGDERANKEQRKRLKKRRRDKLKRLNSLPVDVGKRRKKKHRCCDEHCRHRRHHRRHRKHKHRHSRGGKDSDKMDSDAVSRLSPVLEQLDILEIQQTAIRQLTNENKLREEEEQRKKQEEEDEKKKKKMEEEEVSIATPAKKAKKESVKAAAAKKVRDRQPSVESRSKMAAFLPARQLWGWAGRGFKRPGARGRGKKEFFKSIQRGKETIMVGDCAVFLSTGRPDRPYIGRIESMWESWGTNMVVKVKWFYHPEETTGCPAKLKYPGALFESPHVDENDVQTISHKCEVMPLDAYAARIGSEPSRLATIYDNNDVYYQAGYYDPTTSNLTVVKGVV